MKWRWLGLALTPTAPSATMDTDSVVEVAQVAVSLPGLRGGGVLRRLFAQQSRGGGSGSGTLSFSAPTRELGRPTSVHISPGHVFVILDDGEKAHATLIPVTSLVSVPSRAIIPPSLHCTRIALCCSRDAPPQRGILT